MLGPATLIRSAICAAALAATGTAGASIVIDDFDTGSFEGSLPLVNVAIDDTASGFARTVSAAGNGPLTVAINNPPNNAGFYTHSQNAWVVGSSMIEYTLGQVDLTQGANAFRVTLQDIDIDAFIRVSVQDSSGAFAMVDVATSSIINANGGSLPAAVDILFASFLGTTLADAATVKLTIDGSFAAAMDAMIARFETVCSNLNTTTGGSGDAIPLLCPTNPPVQHVPGPAPVILLLAAALSGIALRRRHQTATRT